MSDEGDRRGGISKRRRYDLLNRDRSRPRRARLAQHPGHGAERLAGGAGGVEETAAVEMIADARGDQYAPLYPLYMLESR